MAKAKSILETTSVAQVATYLRINIERRATEHGTHVRMVPRERRVTHGIATHGALSRYLGLLGIVGLFIAGCVIQAHPALVEIAKARRRLMMRSSLGRFPYHRKAAYVDHRVLDMCAPLSSAAAWQTAIACQPGDPVMRCTCSTL